MKVLRVLFTALALSALQAHACRYEILVAEQAFRDADVVFTAKVLSATRLCTDILTEKRIPCVPEPKQLEAYSDYELTLSIVQTFEGSAPPTKVAFRTCGMGRFTLGEDHLFIATRHFSEEGLVYVYAIARSAQYFDEYMNVLYSRHAR